MCKVTILFHICNTFLHKITYSSLQELFDSKGSQMDSEKCEMTDDLIRETDRFWEDPQKIMHLIDLLFLWEDPDKKQVCS